ncbi:hypothetical protein DSAG12_00803 [Promethearchaeum syntrophicum]|uniref:Uncharacterized protein n=1 Tax=Promethearchaeum syntrophicum TaxID=2594042 RepID=A0A5B9D8A3_9ARCH|nr:hypothetical protein [Candidatus Prometheoarchaeum syntrophicum]QEE14980.1 hypothetical protein DSAG12_00803 [Candidatus Prometheoarchaeum syntrophicum]
MDLNLSKINKKFLIKGAIYALMLMVAPILGILMRSGGSNQYLIFGFVAAINIIAVIGVFKMLKDDLFEEEKEEIHDKKKKITETTK